MKVSNLLGMRFKETPADCQTANHIFMVRGGYIKQVASGIFSLYPPMRRVTKKVEAIIREEMDRIDGQEVLFPVVMPASLWQESGRYGSIGSELARFTDRSGTANVLGMTHEEASVQLTRDVAASYQQYPFMIYQIQTKFRDEPRSRGGLIRVREFIMKDAYSFHTAQADLERYYDRMLNAYNRIFARVGIPEVVSVKSDSGMMGGSCAHEFMLLSDIGEDTIALCPDCDFRANMEAAECIIDNQTVAEAPFTKLETPGVKTIDDLCKFVGITPQQTAKAVVYQRNEDDTYIVIFIRGDLEVNETKLRNFLGCEVHPAAVITAESGLVPGSIGAVGLPENITTVFDRSLAGCNMLYCGANDDGYHYSGLSMPRDLPDVELIDVAKVYEGGTCPQCGKHNLKVSKGVEVGNIFQLGTKYSASMNMQYTDENGELQTPIMGSYGIGVGRLAACVLEAHNDKYGPIWPMSIAPWQVQICALNAEAGSDEHALADDLYRQLQNAGVEVLYDDRPVSAGFMFSDADLFGCPLRLVVSPKNCKRGAIEFSARDKSFRDDIAYGEDRDLSAVVAAVKENIRRQLDALNA